MKNPRSSDPAVAPHIGTLNLAHSQQGQVVQAEQKQLFRRATSLGS
jgi:hypothetical protein